MDRQTDRQTPSQKQRYTTPFPTPAGIISACWKRFHQRFTTSFWILLTECHDNIQTKTPRPKGALNAHSIGNKKLSYRWQTARCWFVKLLNVTDGQTDRRMNRQTAHDSINRACIASRGKNASQHVPVYLQQFPVIRTTIAKNRHFYVPRPSFFVCPGDAPVKITQNVAWMKRQFSACQTPRSMYVYFFSSFRIIRCLSQCVSP